LDAYGQWADIIDGQPDLREGMLADKLVESMKELEDMLDVTNSEWPDDFPMQEFIDYRSSIGEPDSLPTTDDLEERNSQVDDDEDGDDEDEDQGDESDTDSSGSPGGAGSLEDATFVPIKKPVDPQPAQK
jgi:hypothetical protein